VHERRGKGFQVKFRLKSMTNLLYYTLVVKRNNFCICFDSAKYSARNGRCIC